MAASNTFLYRFLPGMVIKRLDDWRTKSCSQGVNILITGKTGIGKSTLVNGLVGSVLAVEGETLQSETNEVRKSYKRVNNIDINVWDSPGLQDESVNEEKYLEDMAQKCKDKIDLFIYCHDMSEDRFDDGGTDVVSMKLLTNTLGKEVWNNAVIVLTMANMTINDATAKFGSDVENIIQEFTRRLTLWETAIRSALKNAVKLDQEIVSKVKVLPAGHYNQPLLLPNDEIPWLSCLWFETVKACKPEAQPAFIKINEHRLREESKRAHVAEGWLQPLIHQQFIACVSMDQKLGSQLGMPPDLIKKIGWKDGVDQSIILCLGVNNGYVKNDDLEEGTKQLDLIPDRQPID